MPHRTKDFMSLDISIRGFSDVTVLDLRGRSTISGGESELLSGHLKELVAKGVRKLLLNMADLSQVDSSGVGIIIETRYDRWCARAGVIWRRDGFDLSVSDRH
jgi:anti-anti-sigma regulatory factor